MVFYVLLLLSCLSASAHQASLNTSGNELFWANPTVPVVVKTNTSDLTSSQVLSVITDSMNQWNTNSRVKINSVSSSSNEIRFESNWNYGSAVLAITEISYGTSGAIQKANILINDTYNFKAAPGYYYNKDVFLGDVVTHEIGHLFGLSHSEVLNSSMFYSSFPGQATVASDDKAGIRQKYDTGYGSITGYVKGGNSIGVLGVHIQAISRSTGEASGAITDEKGYFRLGGLDLNDTYYLYTSPIKNSDSLPGYFSNVQTKFCPGSYVGSFFNACGRENDGKPQGITLLSSRPDVNVGVVTINCSLKTDEEYDYRKLQTSFSPFTIFNYPENKKSEEAFVGWFRKSLAYNWTNYDYLKADVSDFTNLSGNPKYLKISLVSYPLGTPLQYEMNVRKDTGLLSYKTLSTLSTGTYFTDFDSFIPLSSNPDDNVFDIEVRGKLLQSYAGLTFPSFATFTSDQHMPYMIITSLYENTSEGLKPILDTAVNWSDNDSCLDAPFTYAVAKTTGTSTKDSESSTGESASAGAACGTIEPPNSGPGNSLPLFVSGFLLTMILSSVLRPRKKFLS